MRHWCAQLVHVLFIAGSLPLVGCGTTRFSDTARTATEQLLVSDAIDRAVQSLNVSTLSGQTVFLDDSRLTDATDRNYLISTLRQHLLASGCYLREKREDADFIVEARAGAVGTDRNDLLFGIPSMNVPQIMPLQPVPAAIPEVPVAKRRHQIGIVKIAVFAFHRETGTPVWQSGLALQESSANDVWILGAGPFQRGTIHVGTEFAGRKLGEEHGKGKASPKRLPPAQLARASTFTAPNKLVHKEEPAPAAAAAAETPASAAAPAPERPVVQAIHTEPAPVAEAPAAESIKAETPAPPPANTSAAPETQPASAPAAAAQTSPSAPATPPVPTTTAEVPAASTVPPAAPPATTSVYAPAGTSQLPQPRFDSP